MRYHYQKVSTTFIGNNTEEIIDTLRHYYKSPNKEITLPASEQMSKVEILEIQVLRPIFGVNQFIEAKVLPDVIFNINANCFDSLREFSRSYESTKLGSLYKFRNTHISLFFLPEDIMIALKEYNWNQHVSQLDQWLGARESGIEEGIRRGLLG